MVIKNQKALNKNEYDKIHIGDNINVYALGIKSRLETISTGKFTDTLKDLSDSDKKKEVVRYFLRNNTISLIKIINSKYQCINGIHEKEEYLIIESITGKILRIKKEDVSEELLREIYFKYECDRLDYFEKNEFDFYTISKKSTISTEISYYSEIADEYAKGMLPDEFIGKQGLYLSFELSEDKISEVDKKILETILYIGEVICLGRYWESYIYRFKTENHEYKYLKIDSDLDYKVFYPMLRELEQNKKRRKNKTN